MRHDTALTTLLLLVAAAIPASLLAQGDPIDQDEIRISVFDAQRFVDKASVTTFASGFAVSWLETDGDAPPTDVSLHNREVRFRLDLSSVNETDGGIAFGVRSGPNSIEFDDGGASELLTGLAIDETPGVSGDIGIHRWSTGETTFLTPLGAFQDDLQLAPSRVSSRFGLAYVSDEGTGTNDIYGGKLTVDVDGFILVLQTAPLNEVTTGSQVDAELGFLQFTFRGEQNDGYLVVWQSFGAPGDGSGSTVQGRLADVDMNPLGAQFQISPGSVSAGQPAVATNPQGGALVVYGASASAGSDSSGSSVQAQRFDSLGAPVGSAFQVNSYTTGFQDFPTVAALRNGEYIVAWNDRFRSEIVAQRLAQDGTPLGGEFLVSRTTNTAYGYPDIAANGNDFLVVWQAQGAICANGVVEGRLFEDGFESGNTGSWSLTAP